LTHARSQDTSSFNWKQSSGTKIVVILNKHPYAEAIIKRLPTFKELTGIDVEYSVTPEENYFDKVTTSLVARNGNPDVFMTGVYQMWDYATSDYIESLDSYLADSKLTSPDDNVADIVSGVLAGGKWDLKPGSPTGTGSQWALPLGFEAYILSYNKKLFQEKGLQPPKTLDELAKLAKELKGWSGSGSYGLLREALATGRRFTRLICRHSPTPERKTSRSRMAN
jgi:multiple sugar transport system substrate-binding protein